TPSWPSSPSSAAIRSPPLRSASTRAAPPRSIGSASWSIPRPRGGQGTLGGLSGMAEQAGALLARATKRLALCSNDPICAEHSSGSDDYPLQGAACHACLLVPETSCEARNSRLDRGLLAKTVLGKGLPLIG